MNDEFISVSTENLSILTIFINSKRNERIPNNYKVMDIFRSENRTASQTASNMKKMNKLNSKENQKHKLSESLSQDQR
jgi:uncharacterized membrane protein (DUF106 family)